MVHIIGMENDSSKHTLLTEFQSNQISALCLRFFFKAKTAFGLGVSLEALPGNKVTRSSVSREQGIILGLSWGNKGYLYYWRELWQFFLMAQWNLLIRSRVIKWNFQGSREHATSWHQKALSLPTTDDKSLLFLFILFPFILSTKIPFTFPYQPKLFNTNLWYSVSLS